MASFRYPSAGTSFPASSDDVLARYLGDPAATDDFDHHIVVDLVQDIEFLVGFELKVETYAGG